MSETFAQTLRQMWIDAVIDEEGEIGRGDICRAFGVSTVQASTDLGRYLSAHPGRIAYDPRLKSYQVIEGTRALHPPSARQAAVGAVEAVRVARSAMRGGGEG